MYVLQYIACLYKQLNWAICARTILLFLNPIETFTSATTTAVVEKRRDIVT